VRGPDGERGIWFFSLDAARALAVLGARAAFGLPYAWSRMRVEVTAERIRYQSFRHWPDRTSMSRIDVEPGTPVPSGQIEIFLTARYRLYSFIGGVLTYTQVEHAPWPLRTARIVRLEQTITRTAGLPEPDGPPLVHFSTGVTVRVAYPKPVHLAHRLRTAGRYTLGKA
jgi:uncharacterized protein YqjF (DUF2071 family)